MNMIRMMAIGVAAALAASLAGCSKPPAYNTASTVKEIMAGVIDPQAQVFWHSSGSVDDAAGSHTLTPTTPEGWAAAEHAMTTVAEAGNLLMLPGRAPDEEDWVKFAKQMTDQALAARAATRAKDGDKMFEIGAAMYDTCQACHQKYLLPYLDANGKPKPGSPLADAPPAKGG
jgi:hypothetical protein